MAGLRVVMTLFHGWRSGSSGENELTVALSGGYDALVGLVESIATISTIISLQSHTSLQGWA